MLVLLLAAAGAFAQHIERKDRLRELGILKTDQCDVDCDGKLSAEELEAIGLEDSLPEGVLLTDLDRDGDGMISQNELDSYYKSEEIRKEKKLKNLQNKARESNQPKIHF